ncbi:MAG: HK97-gp10 family putative phage morphogenesis protein [Nitrososphaerales archaeon]
MSIEGLKRVDSSLWNLSKAILFLSDEALNLAAETAVDEGKRLAPVRTGRLRNSIRILERGRDYAVVGSDVEYAPFVEYGTRRISPRPYLRPAVEKAVDAVDRFFLNEVDEKVG